MERLKDLQSAELSETDLDIKKWEKFKVDYEALRTRLLSLPDTLSQDVMVPFGSKAFMPGRLVHTNEILVLLGNNWFAERSAKQAAEIVTRRLKAVDDNLARLQDQRRLLVDRQQFTDQLFTQGENGEFYEIQEKYDPEAEALWKEKHRQNVREHRRKMKEQECTDTESLEFFATAKPSTAQCTLGTASENHQKSRTKESTIEEKMTESIKMTNEKATDSTVHRRPTNNTSISESSKMTAQTMTGAPMTGLSTMTGQTMTDAAVTYPTVTDMMEFNDPLWRRLEELEKAERENDEINQLCIDEIKSTDDQKDRETVDQSKSVRWEDDDSSETDEDSDWSRGSCITFTHTPTTLPMTTCTPTSSTITSPGDIYPVFYKPSSILKMSGSGDAHNRSTAFSDNITEHGMAQTRSENRPSKSETTVHNRPTKVHGLSEHNIEHTMSEHDVRERNVTEHFTQNITEVKTTETSNVVQEQPRKISKFKQERQKKLGLS